MKRNSSSIGPAALFATWLLALPACAPAFAAALTKSYAQGLVDRIVYLRPELQRVDLIAAAPGSAKTTVIASMSAKAVGLPATASPMATSDKPACRVVVPNYECTLPLHDTPRATIGSIAMALPYFKGQSTQSLQQTMLEVRDELAETTPGIATLFEERTIASKPGDLQAQCMVHSALAHHPELMVLAFHVAAPGSKENRMLAINVAKFMGDVSEPVEHELALNGNVLLETIAATHRLKIHVPLLAANGELIGSLATGCFWHKQEETTDALARTFAVQQELKPQIRDRAALFEPCDLARDSR